MKKWYQSKTYWFNISLSIVAMLQANLNIVQKQLGSHYGYVLLAISAIGIVLRSVTKEGIKK